LVKDIEKRITITNLNMFIDYFVNKHLIFYINSGINQNILQKKTDTSFIQYRNIIIQENIIFKFRENAIHTLLEFIINEGVYGNENDIQYLPLGLLLFDRYMSIQNKINNSSHSQISEISLQFFYTKTLFVCYYISSKYLLNDIDIIFICEFLNIDIEEIHIDILDILQQLDFDIYRPTILTYLNQQNEDIYHSKYIIDNSIEIFCNSSCICTDYEYTISIINELISFEQNCFNQYHELNLNILQNNTNDIILDIKDNLEIPKLKRNVY